MSNNTTNANIATRVTTGKVRFSYEHLTNPRPDQSGELKYSVTLLIPKSDTRTYNAILTAIETAREKGKNERWGGVVYPKQPLHDGDGLKDDGVTPYGDECHGCWVVTASSKTRPGIVDVNLQAIMDSTQIYSGIYGRAALNFYPYNNPKGGKGVACGLNNVQKIEDGEPLAGGTRAEDDFNDGFTAVPQQPNYQPAPAPAPYPTYPQPGITAAPYPTYPQQGAPAPQQQQPYAPQQGYVPQNYKR